jgi:F-type H+-transporting ATPase subunit epsilon
MTEQLQFELVSPEKLILSKPVAMVTVPGGEGDYGVLIGHSPMITTVRPGVITVYDTDENTISDRIFIAGGFAEVTAERCTILAEEAISVAELHHAQLVVIDKELNEELSIAISDAERAALEMKIAVVEAKIQATQTH